ncbi:MAG: DSD1 family PLP-dependent enzyme, partial [Pirellulaceae bacterium]|nr:DSD1 family PLP-dependent enzyme [Pirellulaceae bacterium]
MNSVRGPAPADGWIGAPLEDLDTPALLLDRSASDYNLQRMAEFFRGRGCQLRPHFKNHKCVTLARRQLDAGSAVGITCAKLGEAEVLADGGVGDVLIANQVVGSRKMARLAELARRIDLKVAVDDIRQAEAISQAAAATGATVGVLVEVDIGSARCGVAPGEPALELARRVLPLAGLRFDGLQAYEGHAVYVNDPAQRERLVRQAFDQALQTRRLIEASGIEVRILSGGSSSTHQITGTIEGVTEVQAGSYATMDWRYAEMLPDFKVALSVLARVISKRPGVAVLDVGLKGAGCEFGLPRIKDHPQAQIPSFVSEEHSIVCNAPDWKIGQAVELLPSHACTTCNLHRQIVVHEDRRVV